VPPGTREWVARNRGARHWSARQSLKRFLAALIPEQICRLEISPGAKLITADCTATLARTVLPSLRSTLAEETGLGETQARGYIKELEKVDSSRLTAK